MFNMRQMKEAMALRKKLKKMQKELKKARVEATEENGKVRVVVDGEQNLVAVEIAEDLLTPENRKKLQQALVRATNTALKQSKELAQQRVQELLGAMPEGFDVGSLLSR